MHALSDQQVVHYVDQLRESVSSGTEVTDLDLLEAGFSLVNEAVRRTFGYTYYDVQLLAGMILTRGGIAEMATGEGKTLTAALPAFMHALKGHGVHVASANTYLAERDQELLQPVFERLGMSCGLAKDQATPEVKRPAYDCDITYATGHEFGFDYLRDQVSLRGAEHQKLGKKFLSRLAQPVGQRARMQRGLAFAIIDEADNILLDDAVSPLLLSQQSSKTAEDAALYIAACDFAATMAEGDDFFIDPRTRQLLLTQSGLDRAHAALDEQLPLELLQHPWAQYVEQSLKARHLMQRDVHYIVNEEEEVQIVDESTGRIFTDRSWRDGLHQAVEAKEGVNITGAKLSLARITRQRFYRLYGGLCGMTGTATGSESEFQHVYGVGVAAVPLRCPSRRVVLPTVYFPTRDAKWDAVAKSIQERHREGQPILVGTRSIADSWQLASILEDHQLPFQLLNGRQDAEEAEVIASAGEVGAVTIATNLAGRGTDIKLSAAALECGGLHVIAGERHTSSRIDRQLIGRCARQGDPGTAQFFVSAEDDIPVQHSPAIAAQMRRLTQQHTCPGQFDPALRRIQQRIERRHETQRRDMLRMDLERDSVLAKFWGEN
ncbi:MAG: hypothetical protein KDA58_02250 [Planctomycetaceae bacterium]|nr:hypothetical protein [Planctomycetaceae bacterium]